MWFIAHTHEGLQTIQLRSAYATEFPRFRHYHSGNTIGHYRYLSADLSAGDVTGLQADQVEHYFEPLHDFLNFLENC